MRTLVVNPGSSSLKVSLVEDGHLVPDRGGPYDAIGVRFVHGGPDHTAPVLVDDRVLADLDAVSDLAPLPPAIS